MSGPYRDLEVWGAAIELVTRIYKISGHFPKEEMYGLIAQLRRAAVSVPSNIAEGKGRLSDKELIQFLCHARGSLFELETQLHIAKNLGYVSKGEAEEIGREATRIGQMLNGLMRSVRPAA